MSHGEVKVNKWRQWCPRFSVRTLVIFVTVVSVYLGAWETTKKYGVNKPPYFQTGVIDAGSYCPFLIWRHEVDGGAVVCDPNGKMMVPKKATTRHYLWWFKGPIQLPFESEWTPTAVPQD